MGWFDEQLRLRKQKDDESFADALGSIAGVVMGRSIREKLDAAGTAQSAVDEILRFYHCKVKQNEIPSEVDTPEDRIEYRLRPFGIMHRSVKLDKGWYKHAVGAMLGRLKADGSAVALIPGKFSGYSFTDGRTGKKIRLNRKTEQLLDEEAVAFYKPLPMKALKVTDLLKFVAEQLSAADVVIYLGMMAITAAVGLLSPMFTRWLFGIVLDSGSVQMLLALAGFMVCYSVSRLLIAAFQSLINFRVSVRQNIAVQAAVMNRVMSLPAPFFRNYAAGELTRRASYVQSLCSILMNSIGITGITSLFSLIYIGQIFSYAPALVAPSIALTVITLSLSLITTAMQRKVSSEKMLIGTKNGGMTYSIITGIQKIKLAGAEKRMFSRWAKQYSEEASLAYNPPALLKLSGTVNLAVSLTGSMILYWMAVRSGVSVSDYYAFNAAYGMVSGAFMAVASIATTVANIRPTLEMAKPIMEAEPEITEGVETITELSGAIEVSDVSFRYDDSMPYVLDGLSLKIRPGEYVAIVGATGCGKSTLLRLLLGFEKPQKGAVYYDRKDISKVNLKSLRQKIGVVMQNGKLFLGDIYSNIAISAPYLTLAEAWEAAEKASIADDIRQMPMGMNTVISEGQGGISGGQRQRLMIARAIASKPKILMFDEATSALDNLTQKKVSEAIDSLGCTRIVIAHRLSTIRHCDRIIVLDKGKIAESGTYEELIAQNGIFAALVERQRLDTETE